ncbi:ABC transporter permease [Nocardioides sp. LMS-CY]|uniref:ABC transporter permease n=1 Tax=Nocardioides sp. (strain LMS-CY) TaxID=2840457 RepID=UPI001C000462|nr:ABC transporter permease [Nocardioides sp. LMS-CY]QWF20797.1 ABC transporter permease [Nocardioides sp. LMS-CY]
MERRRTRVGVSALAVAAFIGGWALASRGSDPTLLPGPAQTVRAAHELWQDGTLLPAIGISLRRIALGWILGCAIAVPLGLIAGISPVGRSVIDPFIHFFRFIPAIALTSLFILWFGIGESSKVYLVAYAAGFIVTVNTAAGAAAVPADKLSAARCVGASRIATLTTVTIPATVPHIFTGMRLALANAFLVIVAAEALATQSGLGYLIWNSRIYFRTDQIFVGILFLGALGFVADRLWKLVGRTLLRRFMFTAGTY